MTSAGPLHQVDPARVDWWSRNFSRLLWVNAMLQVLIIVSGGVVRLTGSGLGCPTWPQCVPGSYTPVPHQEQGIHKFIEFGNRTLTGVLLVAALLAVIAVFKVAPRRHLVRSSIAVLALVALQGVIGGITVLVGLHPATVATHFLVSAGLVAIATHLYLTRHEPDGPRRLVVPQLVQRVALATCVVAAVVLLLGTVVTGSGPHSGDAETPARFGFDPRTISWLHADAVMLFIGLVVAVWIAVNMLGAAAFDPYPFILLNLAFSLQAAYAAPLILLAQTRQATRDKAHAEADAQHREALAVANEERQATAAQNAALMLALLEQNTQLTAQTREMAARLEALTVEIHQRFVASADKVLRA